MTNLDSGETKTVLVGVTENSIMLDTMRSSIINGKRMTNFMKQKLQMRNFEINFDEFIIKILKEKYSFCLEEFVNLQKVLRSSRFYQKTVELPDSTQVDLLEETFETQEIIFHPEKIGFDHSSLQKEIYSTIQVRINC